MIASQK